jgi:hypothetical protein
LENFEVKGEVLFQFKMCFGNACFHFSISIMTVIIKKQNKGTIYKPSGYLEQNSLIGWPK